MHIEMDGYKCFESGVAEVQIFNQTYFNHHEYSLLQIVIVLVIGY